MSRGHRLDANLIESWRGLEIDPATIENYINEFNKIGCTSFKITDKDIEYIEEIMNMSDAVNNPSHYTEGRKYEPIKVISDWQLDFALGNTVKYISRAGRKTSAAMSDIEKEIQDLEKAEFYLKYKINELYEQKKKIIKSDNPYQE